MLRRVHREVGSGAKIVVRGAPTHPFQFPLPGATPNPRGSEVAGRNGSSAGWRHRCPWAGFVPLLRNNAWLLPAEQLSCVAVVQLGAGPWLYAHRGARCSKGDSKSRLVAETH